MKTVNRISSDGRCVTVCRFEHPDVSRLIEVTVSYTKAGISFWDYHKFSAGNRMSFKLVTVDTSRGFEIISMGIGGIENPSCYFQIDESERFSRKNMLAIATDTALINKNLALFIERYHLPEGWN